MAVSPTPPPITLLPSPPLPTDPESVFDSKAGASLTAQAAMVPEVNAALAWQAGSMAETKGYKDAAAISAGAASDSAIAANSSKNAAAQQVGLAADQVALANTAKGEAQAAALAAGAAVGLPPERVPFSVLQINGAGAVGWGYGLPDRAAAQAGYSLILGPGKVPTWGFAGDQIGDILYTSRAPGSTYLPANGGIYLQSAYPQLFAQIGLIGGQRATSFVAKSATPPFACMGFGEDGVVLGVSVTAGTVGNVYRSTDYGLTFALAATAITTGAVTLILHLGGSKWFFGTNEAGTVVISSDNGSTTVKVSVGASYSFVNAATDKAGTVLVGMSNGTIYRSINYGVSFIAAKSGLGTYLSYAGSGRWVCNNPSDTTSIILSDDAFSTYFVRQLGGTLNSSVFSIACDTISGVIIAISNTVNSLNMAVSFDRGETFSIRSSGTAYPLTGIVYAGADTWLLLARSSTTLYDIRKSTDGAKTFTPGPTVGTSNSSVQLFADQVKGYVIANCQVAGTASYSVSAPVLGYDGATQFKVPTLTKQEGVNPYVKAV